MNFNTPTNFVPEQFLFLVYSGEDFILFNLKLTLVYTLLIV